MTTVVQFGDIIRGLKKLERSVQLKGEEVVRLRFQQGCLLKDVVGKSTYGENAVEQVSKETEIPESTLRIAYGHAKRFNFKEVLLEKEISSLKEAGKTISYGYFRAALKPESNPDLHGGEQKHKEYLLNRVEKAGSDLQTANDHYPNDQEVQGAAIGLHGAIEEAEFTILGNRGTSGTRQGKPWRCPQLLKFIRTEFSCCITGTKPVEAHHMILKSRGNQSDDLFCVPLSPELHREYHAIGHDAFTEKYGVDWQQVMITILKSFITDLLR